jgi:hypothetical protein
MSTHFYESIHVYHIPMSTFERLSQLDLEIHKFGHRECIVIDGDVASY